MLRRRRVLAAAAACVAGAPLCAQEREGAVATWVEAGEAALARGDALGATLAFMRAANREHALDVELGIVRSQMQAGRYREAFAFAAHTAGAHRESPHGAVLYAWLLAAGGQAAVARGVLAQAATRHRDDALLADAEQAIGRAIAAPSMLRPPLRVAPYSAGALPPSARVAGAGVRLSGTLALAPSQALVHARRVWTRDSLGRVEAANVERELAPLGIVVLQLAGVTRPGLSLAARDPFPGSPAMAVGHVPNGGDEAAWPWLHHGFLGTPDAAGQRRLGIELPSGPRASAVFDAHGRWIGVATDPYLLPPSALREHLGAALAEPQPAAAARMPSDAVYELGLSVALQVLVER